jgi:hypothetical protein
VDYESGYIRLQSGRGWNCDHFYCYVHVTSGLWPSCSYYVCVCDVTLWSTGLTSTRLSLSLLRREESQEALFEDKSRTLPAGKDYLRFNFILMVVKKPSHRSLSVVLLGSRDLPTPEASHLYVVEIFSFVNRN